MSRIHEALKKATEERAASVPISGGATLSPEVVTAPADMPVSPTVALPDLAAGPGRLPTLPSGHLRFDDLSARCSHPEWHLDPSLNVFFNEGLSPHATEQFRTLRTRLYQIRTTQSLRTLLITSALAGEGKTFVTSNLAQAIVHQPDRRVLIIDADLRCARLHLSLGAPSSPGLADYLQGDVDETAIIQHGQEGNLCFIPGGGEAANPSELLSNGRLKKLIDRLLPVFDWIILDSPPCLPVADTSILAPLCDGIVLVVRAASTPADVAQRACRELQERNVVGVVLNAIDEANMTDSYYYQADGYGYGYGKTVSKEARQ